MTVQCSQASAGSRIPEFDLMVFRTRDKQSLCGMPITGLDVPIVACQDRVAGAGSEVKYLESRII